jgi:hypothetical protein
MISHMVRGRPLLTVFLFLFLCCLETFAQDESLVHSLTVSSFNKFLEDNPLTLVEFYGK